MWGSTRARAEGATIEAPKGARIEAPKGLSRVGEGAPFPADQGVSGAFSHSVNGGFSRPSILCVTHPQVLISCPPPTAGTRAEPRPKTHFGIFWHILKTLLAQRKVRFSGPM